jgi:hypothetical protein
MNSFKVVLLLGVLGMTWADPGRRPGERTHAFPEAAFEPASTNALRIPVRSPLTPQRSASRSEPSGSSRSQLTLVQP